MEQLKKFGQLCRQHYEKLVLVVVLLLLAWAVWSLYGAAEQGTAETQQKTETLIKNKGKPVESVKLDRFNAAMKAATNAPTFNYSGKHNLFNPVKWQQNRAGGQPIKVTTGKEIGAEAMRIVSIAPLTLSIAFDRAAISGSGAEAVVTGYHTVVTNELATLARLRRIPQFISSGSTNSQVFILAEVKGDPATPTELVAQLKDYDNEKVSFAPGKPYVRTVGYEAELKYPNSGKTYPHLRKDSPVDIDGEPYKVVDISASRVVLSDDSNGKRYTIEQTVAP